MTTPWQANLLSASCIAKQNLISNITCPECGEQQLVIKWAATGVIYSMTIKLTLSSHILWFRNDRCFVAQLE